MELTNRIDSFTALGQYISSNPESLQAAIRLAGIKNHWFTYENCVSALNIISQEMLNKEKLTAWLQPYNLKQKTPKTVGIVAAGNIPLVSFHDILSVLITGNKLLLKTSEKDSVLPVHLLNKLIEIKPEWKKLISINEKWVGQEAVIATGSDNSSRYFEYYLGRQPHIIRKNRHSVAVLTGNETPEDLYLLGKDVFEYYGLGCRNISLIWLPKGYKFDDLITAWEPFSKLMNHHSYKNNLDYHRTIHLMNGTPIVDCDFVNLVDNTSISSPISCVNLAYYDSPKEIKAWLDQQDERIQAVVNFKDFSRNIDFGGAQTPSLTDYADGIDTIEFLTNL